MSNGWEKLPAEWFAVLDPIVNYSTVAYDEEGWLEYIKKEAHEL